MRPFPRLESEPKSRAIFGYLIISATLNIGLHCHAGDMWCQQQILDAKKS